MVEPRRVACRGLAQRVAELQGVELGSSVGYTVRDDRRGDARTAIHFATPGVVLRWLAAARPLDYTTVILDEFHERGLETDLLLALLLERFQGPLLVMSATMQGERIATHIQGRHLHAPGRTYPVKNHYLPGSTFLPDSKGLEERVLEAVARFGSAPGDFLVFMPGKGEIRSVAEALKRRTDLEVLEIHGGLTLKEQSRVFQPAGKRRAIVATNVAETSITIPGIGIVIDSGLVRRTRYHNGRGYLTLVPIAKDSADQRSGRAGRLGPGLSVRLWSPQAVLPEVTPPEIYRENLAPMVLACAACGAHPEHLPFLDAPKPFALEQALDDLRFIRAVDSSCNLTERGRLLSGLPLDAPLGALLAEAEKMGNLDDAIDLVSVLSVGRPLFRQTPPSREPNDIGFHRCDAVAVIRALRTGHGAPDIHGATLEEALLVRRRLRDAWSISAPLPTTLTIDRHALALAALRSDPRTAHIPRRRKKKTAWSNGGTEISLGRDSLVDEDKARALVVLDTHAIGVDYRKRLRIITCAMPVPVEWLLEAGLGDDEVDQPAVVEGKVVARVNRTFAGAVLESREEIPVGRLAREAMATLFTRGSIFRETAQESLKRLERRRLFRRLKQGRLVPETVGWEVAEEKLPLDAPPLRDWAVSRLAEVGFESGRDLPLLSREDLLVPPLPRSIVDWCDGTFPSRVEMGDATYDVTYDLGRRRATLTLSKGKRTVPPPLAYLPPFRDFGVVVLHGNQSWELR